MPVEPPGSVLEASFLLRGWLVSRETMRSCRGRGSSGAGRGSKQEAEARGNAVLKRPVGRLCMQLQQAPFSHSPFRPFFWHPHRVSEDGKRVASLIDTCNKPLTLHPKPFSPAANPPSLHSNSSISIGSSSSSSQRGALEFTN